MRESFHITKRGHKWTNVKALNSHLERLPEGAYEITIKSKTKRTGPQNNWLHSVLPEIVQGLRDAGYNEVKDKEDAKAVIKALFFKKKITNGTETIEVIEGTSEQSKMDFIEKADEIIRWAAEYLGINIAPPAAQLEIL